MSILSSYQPSNGGPLNPELWKIAAWRIGHNAAALEKTAIVPGGGGGDPGAPPGASAGGGDPAAGGGPPPGGPPPGGPPPGGPPPGGGAGTDPAMAGATGAPAGPLDPAALAQIAQMMQQQGGGPGGKGKSPKDQIQQGQSKIMIHLLAQIASKMGIQVDPQLLVPATDPATDQMAMQETQNASMVPSNDPNAPQGGAGGAGGAPGAGGAGAPPGPPPIPPMDASQGPIGKSASIDFGMTVGQMLADDVPLPNLQRMTSRAFAIQELFRNMRAG